MSKNSKLNVLGVMTGTSMDGVDISLIKTNGTDFVKIKCEKSYKFDKNLSLKLKKTEFKVFNSYLDKFGFSITPGYIFFLLKELKSFDIVHMHVFRTFQNIIIYLFCNLIYKN